MTTLDELKAMYAAMTKGPWEADSPNTIMAPLGRIAGNYDYEEGGIWAEDDTRGIVALHNAFPALVELIERQRAALEVAKLLLSIGGGMDCAGGRQIEAALADKPLTTKGV